MTILTALPNKICGEVRRVLPDLRSCDPHAGKFDLDELKKRGIPTPGVLVSVMGGREAQHASGGWIGFNLSCTAYIVTHHNPALPRNVAAANIATALARLIGNNDWSLPDCGTTRDLRLHVLDTVQVRSAGLALWALTWLQPVTLSETPDDGPLGATLYVSQAPDVGADRAGDYQQVGGAS